MDEQDDLEGGLENARACPDCGTLVPFIEWPGEEVCPGCDKLLFVNSTGQISRSAVPEMPD
jgi:uncharacterized Zn finger protein (UPF0148 family)